jgi:hypothetical protein
VLYFEVNMRRAALSAVNVTFRELRQIAQRIFSDGRIVRSSRFTGKTKIAPASGISLKHNSQHQPRRIHTYQPLKTQWSASASCFSLSSSLV